MKARVLHIAMASGLSNLFSSISGLSDFRGLSTLADVKA